MRWSNAKATNDLRSHKGRTGGSSERLCDGLKPVLALGRRQALSAQCTLSTGSLVVRYADYHTNQRGAEPRPLAVARAGRQHGRCPPSARMGMYVPCVCHIRHTIACTISRYLPQRAARPCAAFRFVGLGFTRPSACGSRVCSPVVPFCPERTPSTGDETRRVRR